MMNDIQDTTLYVLRTIGVTLKSWLRDGLNIVLHPIGLHVTSRGYIDMINARYQACQVRCAERAAKEKSEVQG